MQGASYFREQARLCLEVAQQISDARAAANLRAIAAGHLARAADLEVRPETSEAKAANPRNGSEAPDERP
jgi:hypothetical protein